MRPTDPVNGPALLDGVLQSKILEPLPPTALAELERLQSLDPKDFNEQEVRSFFIDPIVRILGYTKGADFSVDLERKITFLDADKRPDYRFNLWEENFWLIEAKKPRSNRRSFGYKDLAQALEYACHPEINAALVVLCDGEKFEIFDREVSVTEPVLNLRRENLVAEFDSLRRLLEPWQVWFFQKRRVARLIDKVFSKEFNLGRVDEFKKLVAGRLENLRSVVIENFRAVDKDEQAEVRVIKASPLEELVEVHMFLDHPMPATTAKLRRLVELSSPRSFDVLYRIFPDHPRDANDFFYVLATCYLMALSEQRETVEWLPAWLSPGRQSNASVVETARTMIRHCLTYFGEDESRRVIQLAAAALRRVQKLLFIGSEAQWRQAEIRHGINRYVGPEQQWSQFIASTEGQASGMLRTAGIMATSRFVADCKRDDGRFNTEIGKLRLKELWQAERELLDAMPNYARLRDERAIGDFEMTEASCVTYDGLGHGLLCLLQPFPTWRAYIQDAHRDEVAMLASMGSWSARELLSIDFESPALASETDFADRFFFGDVKTFNALRRAYTGGP